MLSRTMSIAAIAAIALTSANPALASGKPVECYKPYHVPPVYGTVEEDVMLHPARRQVDYSPPIYGTERRLVELSPAYVTWEMVPPVTKTYYKKVKVADGGYAWEWRWINGKRVLCKVRVNARYELMGHSVVVRPAHRRKVVVPAQYGWSTEQVVVRPGHKRIVDVPPTYRTVTRQVVVEPGHSGWQRVRIPRHC